MTITAASSEAPPSSGGTECSSSTTTSECKHDVISVTANTHAETLKPKEHKDDNSCMDEKTARKACDTSSGWSELGEVMQSHFVLAESSEEDTSGIGGKHTHTHNDDDDKHAVSTRQKHTSSLSSLEDNDSNVNAVFDVPNIDDTLRQQFIVKMKSFFALDSSSSSSSSSHKRSETMDAIHTTLRCTSRQNDLRHLVAETLHRSPLSLSFTLLSIATWSMAQHEDALAEALLRFGDEACKSVHAQHALGALHCRRGQYTLATAPLRRAVIRGHVKAMTCLANMLSNGDGVERDYTIALELLLRAARAGDIKAMVALTTMYAEGQGTCIDVEASFQWLMAAAQAGDASSQLQFAMLIAEQDPTTAFNEAMRAAAQDLPAALHFVARCFLMGIGTSSDATKAVMFFKRAAQHGITAAMYTLAGLYLEGRFGINKSISDAVQLLVQACEHGHPLAFYAMGSFYLQGEGGMPQDKAKSFEYFMQGAKAGDQRAQLMVARTYNSGEIVQKDASIGFLWALKSAYQNEPEACHVVAVMYLHGMGVAANDMAGLLWLEKAVKLGVESAKPVYTQIMKQKELQIHFTQFKEAQKLLTILAPSTALNLIEKLSNCKIDY